MLVDRMKLKKEKFPEVLRKCRGLVSHACDAAGIARGTYYNWRTSDADFAATCDAIEEETMDFVESKLYELVDEKHPAAVIFYCKTKGKKRGYVERNEITGKDGGAIQTEELTESQARLYERGIKNIEAAAVARYKTSLEEESGNNSMV